MRRLVVALLAGAVMLTTNSAVLAITTGGEVIGNVGFSAVVTIGGFSGSPSDVVGILADKNPVTETAGLLAGYSGLTLSINWPGGLSALQSGTPVSTPSYIWTLDTMSGDNRHHSLLRGTGIDLVEWEQEGSSGSSTSYIIRLALSSDGKWYSPSGAINLLSDLGWESTFYLDGTVYLNQGSGLALSTGPETQPALVVSGNVNLLGSRTPTTPVIPDASTVTLLATGLLPVAALWRRMKA